MAIFVSKHDRKKIHTCTNVFNLPPFRIDNCLSHYRVYECFRLVINSPAVVTPTRRLLLHSELIHVDPNSPTDTTDRRFYILYNDLFIYCKRQKDGKLVYKGTVILDKATLKPIDSKVANKIYEKHQKSIQAANNSSNGRKLSLFGMKKVQQQQNNSNNSSHSSSSQSNSSSSGHETVTTGLPHRRTSTRTSTTTSSASSTASSNTAEEFTVYGLELYFQFVLDTSAMAYSNQINGYGGAVINNASASDSIRRHILRMNSLEEQTVWTEQLQNTIKSLSSTRWSRPPHHSPPSLFFICIYDWIILPFPFYISVQLHPLLYPPSTPLPIQSLPFIPLYYLV